MNEPVVYFKPGCPFGIRLRTALTLHRVPHRSVRFRDDEDGAARVRDVNDGNEISPTVHIAGRWLANPGWREVRDAATHLSWRSAAVVVATTSMLLVGCSEAPTTRRAPPRPRRRPTTGQSITATSEAPAASALEGTWRAGPISLKETEATLRRYGLGRWVEKLTSVRMPRSLVKIRARPSASRTGAWDLYGAVRGAGQRSRSTTTPSTRSTATPSPSTTPTGSNTHRWTVDGDTLSLEFVTGTMPSLRRDPGRSVPARPVHDRGVHEAGLTARRTRREDWSPWTSPR